MARLARPTTLAALLCATALVAAGCSEKESGIGAGQKAEAKSEATTKKPATPPSAAEVQGTAVAKATGVPKIVSPKGAPPTTLQKRDLKVGTGAVAKAGGQITVNYVGTVYGSSKPFDSSYSRGQPLPFQLGAGMVIPGWDQGLAGMKVGGRRQLIIPAALAYGSQGQGPIPANSTLIFVVDLVSVP